MRLPSQPFDPRHRKELRDELVGRARVWLPEWKPRDAGTDLATAIFEVAARIEAEVTERLNRMPEKTFRGFLHWLGVRGRAGQAARIPVVFQMTSGGNAVIEPVDAPAGVQLQAVAGETPIGFETQDQLRILPGQIDLMVAADPATDGLFLPPAGLLALEAPKAEPTEWQLKAPVSPGASQLQLEPELGLVVDRILREPVSGLEYRVSAVDGAIVTIEPSLEGGLLEAGARLQKVSAFAPFGQAARNRQEHVLYLGSQDALNVEVPAVIEIVNGGSIPSDTEWSYWGKAAGGNAWIRIPSADVVQERGRLFLWKPAGPIEQTKVNEISSRWLKAVRPAGFDQSYLTSQLKLLINCGKNEWPEVFKDRKKKADPSAPTKLEGIANTAPLVLDTPFYPLGREPRLFDAFYVGSKEAFSKPSARVMLDFKLGDNFDSPLAAMKRSTDFLIVGVGGDHKLQTLHQTLIGAAGSQTAQIRFGGSTQPKSDLGLAVDLDGGLRPAAAYFAATSYVAVKAGKDVWLWQSADNGDNQKWTSLGRPFDDGQDVIDVVLVSDALAASLVIYVLGAEGKMRKRDPLHASAWIDAVPATLTSLRRLAPVLAVTREPGQESEAEGLVAIATGGEVYFKDSAGWHQINVAERFDPAVYPLAIDSGAGKRWCFAKKLGAGTILACDLKAAQPVPCKTTNAALLGNAFDFERRGANKVVAVLLTGDPRVRGSARPAVWNAFDDGTLVFADVAVERAQLIQAPIRIGGEANAPRYHLFAGDDGSATVVAFDPTLVDSVTRKVTDAMLFTDARDWSTLNDLFVVIGSAGARRSHPVLRVLKLATNEWAFEIEPGAPHRDPMTAVVYQAVPNDVRVGKRIDDTHIQLKNGDNDPQDHGHLYVKGDSGKVVTIDTVVTTAGKRTAEVLHVLPDGDANDHVDYQNLIELDTFVVTLRPAVALTGLSAALLARLTDAVFDFDDLEPARQTASHVLVPERLAILGAAWSAKPPDTADFTVIAAFSAWDRFEPPRPQNPKLSWEYFDGTAWWHLVVTDGTDSLVKTGVVTFCVPANLKPTDVAGRPNHWIRARLVGGSYGQESVTLITSPLPVSATLPAGSTSQTVQRSTDNIHPPYVVSLTLGYELCCAIAPDVVLSADNHGFKDQSGINRTEGAIVEAFVPLGLTLARLGGRPANEPGGAATAAVATGPSECADCASGADWPAREESGDAPVGADNGGRAIFLGLNTEIKGGPIRILFLLDDTEHEGAYPIRVDALIDDVFQPVVVNDETRGLSETGIVTLLLARSPQPTVLFGQQRRWLRLRPKAGFAGEDWRPIIRSVYVNAAWAMAAETQIRERLGSSDGSPNQRVTIARPPILDGTLKLRVLEPIGRDDTAALRAKGIDVLDVLGPWEGPWVLWKEVTDPADCGPDDRVYALDSENGDITFGDGLHGMVPPPGRDAIVAESYQRGGGADANKVTAWSQVSLVTPLQGVEAVMVPEGGAGGSDPQNPETTVRFAPANLNLRDRALSLHDVEQLALQSSAKVVQARAIGRGAGVKVVVVARGQDPRPSSADRRAVSRYLRRRSPPAWSTSDALEVVAPRLVPVRVNVRLAIDAIDFSGDVTKAAADAIRRLLDAAEGGSGDGWPLGELVTDADVAARLVEIAHVEEVNDIRLTAVSADGKLAELQPLAADQLLQLAADGVQVDLDIAPVEVGV